MSIAITEDHRTLADVTADFLERHASRDAARELLEAKDEVMPSFWSALAELGWLGLHIPEENGGSGFGMPELVVVVEQMGAGLAPGPFVSTIIASAAIVAAAPADVAAQLLPGLADGTVVAGIGFGDALSTKSNTIAGTARSVLSATLANLIVVTVGDDLAIVDATAKGVDIRTMTNLDPTRRSAQVTFDDAQAIIVPGGAQSLIDYARLLLAAEATGVARATTDMAADYARERQQFGRAIAMFQAVKHHCANMLVETEIATAEVWDAARAASAGGEQFSYAAAMAATTAAHAGDRNAQMNIQVHGGIGFTWEHDAHLYLRRALAIEALVDAETAAIEIANLLRKDVKIVRAVELPPEAEAFRAEARAAIEAVKDLDGNERVRALVASGYAVPHWPKPWGRAASAVEQLVIEEEFNRAGVKRPGYQITGWVILTLTQHSTEDQLERWIMPALNQELIWCQLFSEPDAGSDAAGVKTKATRVDGGWLINGQKVWTTGAHLASFGLITVRTNPDLPKHQGITCMVVDMHAEGVEIRPLRMVNGGAEFNEVFFNDVFVPDDDVVGPVDGGWTVARGTLGNESVSIGSGDGAMVIPPASFLAPFDANPERLSGGAGRIGRATARSQAAETLNVRSAQRAVAGGEPGPEGAVTKLLLTENAEEAAAILFELAGTTGVYLEDEGFMGGTLQLMHRALAIAGGTSEIKRNQIGERILGLPRDPLIN
ncbi:Acyl-CoA dehydrogenase/oxidase C-terminal [Acidimicrobiia bacterium]|jgi:alkylation response protein AidB-like acyl-CoA dehydrogenase